MDTQLSTAVAPLTLSEHWLPRSTAALRARRLSPKPQHVWATALRRMWPVRLRAAPCDRCRRSAFEFQQVGSEHLCIRCVADSQVVAASPAHAGAMAVLRVLLVEAEMEREEQRARPFDDRRHGDALRETAEVVMWWLTPRAHRPPDMVAVGESTVRAMLAAFDRVWALRCSTRKLEQIYVCWASRHAKALRVAELTAVDRSYQRWIAAEGER